MLVSHNLTRKQQTNGRTNEQNELSLQKACNFPYMIDQLLLLLLLATAAVVRIITNINCFKLNFKNTNFLNTHQSRMATKQLSKFHA